MSERRPNPLERPTPQPQGPLPAPLLDVERSVLDAEALSAADAWLAVRSVSQRGILAGYHASLTPPEVAEQEGLRPRSDHRGPRVWDKVPHWQQGQLHERDEQIFVSDQHVYFFQHAEDAARYFDNHLLKEPVEYVAVYRAELPLSRLDVDPEMLEPLVLRGDPLPISLDHTLLAPQPLDENDPMIRIVRAAQAIVDELHAEFKAQYPELYAPHQARLDALARNKDPEPLYYDPRRVAATWQLYSRLSRAKQEMLVAASRYSEPVHSLALMHRGAVEGLHYEHFLSDYAMDREGRESSNRGVHEYVEKRLADQAFEQRKHHELYLALTDEHEKRAFEECCWIEDEHALRAEMQRRAQEYREHAEMRKRRAERMLQRRHEVRQSLMPKLGDLAAPAPANGADGPSQEISI